MTKKRKVITAVSIIALIIILLICAFPIIEEKRCRAEFDGYRLEFDDCVYEAINYREIGNYTESWEVICKTTDKVWTIYKIKEYPKHEYVVARTAWEATVLKRTE